VFLATRKNHQPRMGIRIWPNHIMDYLPLDCFITPSHDIVAPWRNLSLRNLSLRIIAPRVC
jgi:hypothetical protein